MQAKRYDTIFESGIVSIVVAIYDNVYVGTFHKCTSFIKQTYRQTDMQSYRQFMLTDRQTDRQASRRTKQEYRTIQTPIVITHL